MSIKEIEMAEVIVTRSGIYTITNSVNGKKYVGSAVRVLSRWSEHRGDLRRGKHHSAKLQKAWVKHGEEAFVFEVIERVELVGELIQREQYWIDRLGSVDGGYNILPTAGSCLGRRHSDATKQKISSVHKGKLWSEERKSAASAQRKGRVISAATREKISLALTGIKKPPVTADHARRLSESNKGREISQDSRRKISAALLGIKKGPMTIDARNKMSESRMGVSHGPRSEDTKLKIAAALRGRKRSEDDIRKMRDGRARAKAAKEQQATQ